MINIFITIFRFNTPFLMIRFLKSYSRHGLCIGATLRLVVSFSMSVTSLTLTFSDISLVTPITLIRLSACLKSLSDNTIFIYSPT